jgi:NAD(P)-dependent dehydrogenase (short-subunit alcohol dehydrogenase family)
MNKKLILDLFLDLFSLEGKTAIVTGGSGLLGVRHCEILDAAGATVYSFDIRKNPALIGVADQLAVDVTNRAACFKAVKKVADEAERVDILVNNAAFNPKVGSDARPEDDASWGPLEEMSSNQWRFEIAASLDSAMYMTQAVARFMIPVNSGSIINVSSTAGITGTDQRKYKDGRYKSAAYGTAKTALLGFTRQWAAYFAAVSPNVRINAICPGGVNSGSMDPEFLKKLGSKNMLGRPATPNDYQGLILFLASEASSFVTASTIVADGGQTAW